MPRLLSNTEPKKLERKERTDREKYCDNVEMYSFKKMDGDEKLPLLPKFLFQTKNGFYKTSSGKKVFSFNGECYTKTIYMSAWCFYNFATNFKKKRMSGDQYDFWCNKMSKEGKGDLLYD